MLNEDAPANREKEIPGQLAELRHMIEVQRKDIESLRESLSSVIGPVHDEDKKHGGPTLDLVPLAQDIHEIAGQVARHNEFIEDILRRIEL
jgi:hypothetical protein